MERRLAAILVADVVGYSRLMHGDEAGTLERLNRLRDTVVAPIIAAQRGRIVKVTGDGFLVEFASAIDAVNAALAWQEAVTEAEDGALPDALKFRIGLNVGDIIIENDDIYGDGVNIAARLEQLAKPGGICISKALLGHVRGRIELSIEDLGELELKNIPTLVQVYRIDRALPEKDSSALSGSVISENDMSRVLGSPSSAPPKIPETQLNLRPRPVIAVLPFASMSRDSDQEFFADGLTEDIITRLSYLRGLIVVSRTSSFAFKGQNMQVQDAAAWLGARYVLEGSVRRSGDRIRVTGQLIDGLDGTHLWAQKYDRRMTDIFEIQDELTHAIVVAMQIELTDGEVILSDPGSTENLAAWEAFYQGVQSFLVYTPESIMRARHMFEQALQHDPDFLDARIYLAWSYWQDSHSDYSGDPVQQLARARAQVDEIKALERSSASALHLEAATLALEHRYDEAVAVSAKAVLAGPCKIFGLTPACLVNVFAGNLNVGLELLLTTIRQTPSTPNDTVWWLGHVLCLLEDYDNAILAAEEYLRRAPNDQHSYTLTAMTFAFAGRSEEAHGEVRKLLRLYPNYSLRQFRHHEAFRDQEVVDRMVNALRDAGLPD